LLAAAGAARAAKIEKNQCVEFKRSWINWSLVEITRLEAE